MKKYMVYWVDPECEYFNPCSVGFDDYQKAQEFFETKKLNFPVFVTN